MLCGSIKLPIVLIYLLESISVDYFIVFGFNKFIISAFDCDIESIGCSFADFILFVIIFALCYSPKLS